MTDVSATSESSLREAICRFGRSLFERGLTPGSSGNISLRLDDGGWLVTPTTPRSASSTQEDLPPRPRRAAPVGRRPHQGDPAPRRPLRQPGFGPGDRASPFHPRRRGLDAAGDRPPRRAAAAHPLQPDAGGRGGARAVFPPRRPGGGGCDPGARRAIFLGAARQSRPVVAGDNLEAAVFATEELEETAKLYLLLRNLNPRHLTPAQVQDLVSHFGLTLPEHGHDH